LAGVPIAQEEGVIGKGANIGEEERGSVGFMQQQLSVVGIPPGESCTLGLRVG
jgi:hypothetical protein